MTAGLLVAIEYGLCLKLVVSCVVGCCAALVAGSCARFRSLTALFVRLLYGVLFCWVLLCCVVVCLLGL